MAKGTFGANITSERIADLGIDSDDIADNAVVGSKILNDAITGAKLADNISITTTGTLDVSGGTFTTSTAQNQAIAASDIALTQTLENKTLISPVINTSVSGTAVLDEDDLASDSDTQIATQQSIKAYIDAQIAANSGGKVVFKSTGKASGNPTTGKTWVAFGSGEYEELTTPSVSYAGWAYYPRGYGYGDCISINTGSGFVDDIPPNLTGSVNWQYTLEYDNA